LFLPALRDAFPEFGGGLKVLNSVRVSDVGFQRLREIRKGIDRSFLSSGTARHRAPASAATSARDLLAIISRRKKHMATKPTKVQKNSKPIPAEESQAMYAKVPASLRKIVLRASEKENRSVSGQLVTFALEAAKAWEKKNPE
jgi:hypothetical protein